MGWMGRRRRYPASHLRDRTASAVDNAWKLHAALTDWTGKVDAKASFALAIESAAMAILVTLADENRHLNNVFDRWQQYPFWAGVAMLAIGIVLAATVVLPYLRTRRLLDESKNNYIYFGHLRHWAPGELAATLRREDILAPLSQQLVIMSKIAWVKHRLLQLSLLSAILGSGLVAFAGFVCLVSSR